MFVNNPEYPVEFWANDTAEIIASYEGLEMRAARLRFMENLSEYISYYEAGMSPVQAVESFWAEEVK